MTKPPSRYETDSHPRFSLFNAAGGSQPLRRDFFGSRRPSPYLDASNSKEFRGSTQPFSPRMRMRRHEPTVSPSSTRERGPIEAMIRDFLLAPARTTTQSRETDLTHRLV
jgi:hypothetical protein